MNRDEMAKALWEKFPNFLEPYRSYEICTWDELSPRGRKPYYDIIDFIENLKEIK